MNNQPLTMGSLFDGSGTWPLAAVMNGLVPLWASEVEPFPIAVTSHHFPDMIHLGDISSINGANIPPVDVLTFSSPCQNLSIAGTRTGLAGSQSGLFFQAIRIITEMRCATNGRYPRFIVWENVYNSLSSNNGADFHSVLEEVAKIFSPKISIPKPHGKWSSAGEILGDGYNIAWRTLDGQHWYVPQRRKRVFLVADLGGCCASQVLFERQGVCWHSGKGIAPWSPFAGDPQGSSDGSCNAGSAGVNPIIAFFKGGNSAKAYGIGYAENVAPTLVSSASGTNCVPDVVYPASYPIDQHQQDARFKLCEDYIFPTLNAHMGTGGNNTPMILQKYVYPLQAFGQYGEANTVCSAMKARDYKDATDLVVERVDKPPRKWLIRKLIPKECGRLNGFPDGWDEIPKKADLTDEEVAFWNAVKATYCRLNDKTYKIMNKTQTLRWYNKLGTDSAKYKMWGNGVVYHCADFIFTGIAKVLHAQ